MTRFALGKRASLAFFFFLLFLAGCSASSDAEARFAPDSPSDRELDAGGAGGAANAGEALGAAGNGAGILTGGAGGAALIDASFFPVDGGPGPRGDASCGTISVGFQRITASVDFVVASSASMTQAFSAASGSTSRWDALTQSLLAMTGSIEHDTRLGIIVVGGPGAADGGAVSSSDGSVAATGGGTCPTIAEVAPGLNNIAKLNQSLSAAPGTSPRSTLDEGIKAAAQRLSAQVDTDPKYIVVITDSDPVSCAPVDDLTALWNAIRAIDFANQQYQIVTRVVGLSEDISDAHLTMLANAGVRAPIDGPAATTFYRASDIASLNQAFADISDATAPCVFRLGNKVDPSSAETGTVVLDDVPLTYGDPNGWTLNSPTELQVLGTACQKIHSTAKTISFGFPCIAIK